MNNTPSVHMTEAEGYYPEVEGGHWSPPHCVARDRVAVIIPFRDRQSHLPVLLKYLHLHQQKQLLEYTVFVVEQVCTTLISPIPLSRSGPLFGSRSISKPILQDQKVVPVMELG